MVPPQMFNMHRDFILHSLKPFPALKDDQDEGEYEVSKKEKGFKRKF